MKEIYFNHDGWVCDRFPYNIPKESTFIEVDEESYAKTFSCKEFFAWRVVNGELVEEQYEEEPKIRKIFREIKQIKDNLAKWKEDVEQVELFGMEREDYQEKKIMCANSIIRLRELEQEVQSWN